MNIYKLLPNGIYYQELFAVLGLQNVAYVKKLLNI